MEMLQGEIAMMKCNTHANIVSFFGAWLHDGFLWIVMEYMDEGSLEVRVKEAGPLTVAVGGCRWLLPLWLYL